jgi:hypothetical protein
MWPLFGEEDAVLCIGLHFYASVIHIGGFFGKLEMDRKNLFAIAKTFFAEVKLLFSIFT